MGEEYERSDPGRKGFKLYSYGCTCGNLFSTKLKILLCLWPTSVLGFCGRFWYIPEVASRPRRPPELALIHQIWRFLQSDTGSKSSIKSKGVYKWRKFRKWRGNLAGSMSKAMNSQVKMPASIVEDNFRKVAAGLLCGISKLESMYFW